MVMYALLAYIIIGHLLHRYIIPEQTLDAAMYPALTFIVITMKLFQF
jgi:hypothetical protein